MVDLQKKFHLSAKDLAEKLNLSTHRSHALRQKLGIDKDLQRMHTFTFGKSKHPRFSDCAFTRMREALVMEPRESTASGAELCRAAPPFGTLTLPPGCPRSELQSVPERETDDEAEQVQGRADHW